jgi:preprotein translocase subunit SecD
VAESEVSTQGSDIIVVEIPGKVDKNLEQTIGSTAQLRFRLEALRYPPAGAVQTPSPTDGATTGSETPSDSTPSDSATTGPKQSPGSSDSTSKNRVGGRWLQDDDATTDPTEPTPTEAGSTPPSGPTTGPPTELVPPDLVDIKDPYAWVANPPQEWIAKLQSYQCPGAGETATAQVDLPSQPLIACDDQGNRYLLGPSMVEGTHVKDASYGIPQQGVGDYVVNVEFDGTGSSQFADVTTKIAGQQNTNMGDQQRLAIVLDGKVLSDPSNDQPITGGRAEISGNFDQEQAKSLANSLKYGALPLSFVVQSRTDEGPELASNQLAAGIVAGIIGLVLVVLYCFLYYRGLAIVVVASLIIAGLLTYACILLLGNGYGFTLTLPGIAGLIVAVGITADSFIVYFERLRDEVRDGRTLRTSVETGWVRARSTILAADGVSMLAALVLFIFAIGVVKGFAFALGLTTFIDVFVVFFFTKPMVTMLSRTKFFGQGHKWSGLDRQHLGMPPLKKTPRTAGGEA